MAEASIGPDLEHPDAPFYDGTEWFRVVVAPARLVLDPLMSFTDGFGDMVFGAGYSAIAEPIASRLDSRFKVAIFRGGEKGIQGWGFVSLEFTDSQGAAEDLRLAHLRSWVCGESYVSSPVIPRKEVRAQIRASK
ncbi:MAG: hypothetical protein JWP74_4178 [Marmoricola sp.]|nr:hypothetical protein [Marmoricola sp.]